MRSIQGKLLLRLLLICSCARAEDPVSKVSNWYYLSITLPFLARDFIQIHVLTVWQNSYSEKNPICNGRIKGFSQHPPPWPVTQNLFQRCFQSSVKDQKSTGESEDLAEFDGDCAVGKGQEATLLVSLCILVALLMRSIWNIKSITNVFNRRVFSMARWLPSARLLARWPGPWLTNRQVFSYIDFR